MDINQPSQQIDIVWSEKIPLRANATESRGTEISTIKSIAQGNRIELLVNPPYFNVFILLSSFCFCNISIFEIGHVPPSGKRR